MNRHGYFLVLGLLVLPGCNAAEDAVGASGICETECPPGTFQAESREATAGESAGGSGGSTSGEAYFGTYGKGKCQIRCAPPRPCCGGEKWGKDSYECAYPCAPGQVPGEDGEETGNTAEEQAGEGGEPGEGNEGGVSEGSELGCGAGQTRCGAICCNPGEECANGGCCNGSCEGKQCGDNGCGKSCGTCLAGTHCEQSSCTPDQPLCENGGLRCGEACCEPAQGCLAGTCCWPNCMNRQCGDDGCGGTCGACEANHACNDEGQCVCMPDCENKNCGGDGCGGVCGVCGTNEECTPLGQCECPTDKCSGGCCPAGTVCNPGTGTCCTPKCAGMECGDNGCGGVCGQCAKTQEECQNGECVCVPQCEPGKCGDDGCGGQCPCETNEVCNAAGVCACPTEVCAGTCCPTGKVCNPTTKVCCTLQCTGRTCGDDGCGRADGCGKCPGAQEQCQLGQCVCVPLCQPGMCGDDGCGGQCPCEAHEMCGVAGKCECPTEMCQGLCCPAGKVCNPTTNVCCTPQCTGRKCGDDSCGRADGCGKCAGAQEQCQLGQCVCVPDCNEKSCGDEGCGGTCGTCPSGASCAAGQCVEIGCADGTREGLRNLEKFPTIAGCKGQTSANYSLRDPKTGSPCGNDMSASYCGRPADVCANGWHVCGANGHPKDLSARLSSWDCMNTDKGLYVAAFSDDPTACDALPAPCSSINYAVCCGADCVTDACKDMIWPGATPSMDCCGGVGDTCGAFYLKLTGDRGVLCCQDPALTEQ